MTEYATEYAKAFHIDKMTEYEKKMVRKWSWQLAGNALDTGSDWDPLKWNIRAVSLMRDLKRAGINI